MNGQIGGNRQETAVRIDVGCVWPGAPPLTSANTPL